MLRYRGLGSVQYTQALRLQHWDMSSWSSLCAQEHCHDGTIFRPLCFPLNFPLKGNYYGIETNSFCIIVYFKPFVDGTHTVIVRHPNTFGSIIYQHKKVSSPCLNVCLVIYSGSSQGGGGSGPYPVNTGCEVANTCCVDLGVI